MPKLEVDEKDLKKLDERVIKEIFGLTKKGNDQERAGWYNQEGKKIFPFNGLPKYSQDLNAAIEAAIKVAKEKNATFRFSWNSQTERFGVSFKWNEANKGKERIIWMQVKDKELLAFRVCSLSLDFLCL